MNSFLRVQRLTLAPSSVKQSWRAAVMRSKRLAAMRQQTVMQSLAETPSLEAMPKPALARRAAAMVRQMMQQQYLRQQKTAIRKRKQAAARQDVASSGALSMARLTGTAVPWLLRRVRGRMRPALVRPPPFCSCWSTAAPIVSTCHHNATCATAKRHWRQLGEPRLSETA